MANFSSTLNEDNNINRSDPSRMYTIGQTPLARLRPEKIDDMALTQQISIIQEVCGDIDPDLIALVFHECDYNIQTTITRIKTGDFEDGGWQTAKSNNKKKSHNNNLGDQILNNGTQSDSERSLSQRTSPTSSLRGGANGGRRRQDHYQYSSGSRTNTKRRGKDSSRNPYIPSNPRYPSRNYPNNNPKPISNQSNPSEINSSLKKNEEITPTTSSSTDEYEFIGGTSQSLTFDNSLKKSSLPSLTKHPTPSSIPQEPVSMHPTIQFSTKPIDIQFGDIQWNDSIPITITPSNSPVLTKLLDDQQSSPINDHEQQTDVQDNLLSNYQTTNNIDRELHETTNRLSSSSISSLPPITNNPNTNNSAEETSHLSDHLADSSQQQVPIQITSSSPPLPPPPNTSGYTSPTSQTNNSFILNTLHNTNNPPDSSNSSAFTPYTTPGGTFQPIPRDYSQTWNQQQQTNYKPTSKPTMVQTGNYPQQTSYQLPPQQQFFVGTSYPYHTPTLYPVITSVDPWSTASFEPYSAYPPTNYLSTYPTQQQYHPNTKHDQYLYDKDFFAHYGQPRLSNNEILNSSQPTKDVPLTSKLSATAASFAQPTSPGTAFYINPVLYTVPTYYTSHQDRTMTYPSVDNRDNRNGASYGGGGGGGNNNRNHYHQQQRTHNNSTWHSQQ